MSWYANVDYGDRIQNISCFFYLQIPRFRFSKRHTKEKSQSMNLDKLYLTRATDRKLEVERKKKKVGVGTDFSHGHSSQQGLPRGSTFDQHSFDFNHVVMTIRGALQDSQEQAEPIPASLPRPDIDC